MFIFDSPESRQWLELRRAGKSSDAIYFEDDIRQPQIINGLTPDNGIEVQDELMSLWKDLVMSLGSIVTLYGYNYEALVKAAREGRLKARKSGFYWLTTMGALEAAVEAGSLRSPKGKK